MRHIVDEKRNVFRFARTSFFRFADEFIALYAAVFKLATGRFIRVGVEIRRACGFAAWLYVSRGSRRFRAQFCISRMLPAKRFGAAVAIQDRACGFVCGFTFHWEFGVSERSFAFHADFPPKRFCPRDFVFCVLLAEAVWCGVAFNFATLPTLPYLCKIKQKSTPKRAFWWGMVDSDHRSQRQQIYSLPPLATREIPHMEPVIGVEPTTC